MKRSSRGVFDKEALRDIGERIRLARGSATQEEFAKKIKVGRTVLANYEAGRRLPDSDTLEVIAEEGGVSVNHLLTGMEATIDPFQIRTVEADTLYKFGYAAALFVFDRLRESFKEKTETDRLLIWAEVITKLAAHFDDVIGDNVNINDSDYISELNSLINELRESERADILELIVTLNSARPS